MNQSLFEFNSDPIGDEVEDDAPGEAVALSVSAAVKLINDQLFNIAGPRLMIEGEVAEYGVSQGKWVRFTLKDIEGGSLLKCFMTIYQLHVDIEDGDRIIVEATPKIYPKYGQFTLNINRIEPVGEGAIAKKLAALKKQLDAEGLFEESRKRAIPVYPGRIGIVTSRDAAAFTDFVRILSNRWGDVDIDLAHVRVQGVNAPPEIVMALNYFNQLEGEARPDVLVLTRGGGSLEDLMAFNDESVVRAVFGSSIPIVVGIGHERDESLAELAADRRASTPSNAAEMMVPDKVAIMAAIEMMERRMVDRVEDAVRSRSVAVDRAVTRVTNVLQTIRFEVERAVSGIEFAGNKIKNELKRYSEKVDGLSRYLKEMDPKRVLGRGYAIVRVGSDIVKDPSKLDKGARLEVELAKGSVSADVI
jgi:exodeoxyribonuclease VII large subunit